MTIEEIQQEYARRAKNWAIEDPVLPIGTVPTHDGTPHLELGPTGEMFLVTTERGHETSRRNTHSIDELLYWIFKSAAYVRAWSYELQNRIENTDSRRIVFPKALEEIGKISSDWRDRLHSEQQKVLDENPFFDRLS